jgi:hypothetical protein
MALLPPRPYRLRRWFVLRIYLIAVLGPLAALYGIGLNLQSHLELRRQLRHELALQRTGAVAPAQVDSSPRKRGLLIHDYRLHFRFADADGGGHDEVAVFSSLGSEADLGQPAQVYYDPLHPVDHVLSPALHVQRGRWGLSVTFVALAGLLLALFGAVAGLELRDLRTARRCAASSDELVLEVVRTREPWIGIRGAAPLTYYFRVPRSGRRHQSDEQLVIFDTRKHTPLFADGKAAGPRPAQRQLVALQEPGGRVLVLRDDLYPFALSKADRRLIQERISAHIEKSG